MSWSVASPPRLDRLLKAAGIDPAAGVQVASAASLPALPFDPGLPLLILRTPPNPDPQTAGPLPGRHVPRPIPELLARLYPASHPIRPLPGGDARALASLTEAELFAGDWLIPALPMVEDLASPHGMAAISARLRAADGCPWDRRQTHLTLRPFVLEEAYELVDAIEHGSSADLAEELGDLFLQVVLHAQLGAEAGKFDLTDVYRTLGAKILRRHPHVFGDVEVSGAEEVLRNWEAIKAAERSDRRGTERNPETDRTAFDGVARALPALAASREIQERASSLGWDWPAVEGVWDKVAEELDELHAVSAGDADTERDRRLHELGDVLFALVNLGRWLRLDPEEALRAANQRWVQRYRG
ncbi:MAG TPA: nucleoside triphosphate pyrophosphohydrolase, partial [Candidatus Limnocylindria bacterium]|nr:nucleoside triphosphate pyrophosphohydrolase [Candidatus Limnocylindria bacterium]